MNKRGTAVVNHVGDLKALHERLVGAVEMDRAELKRMSVPILDNIYTSSCPLTVSIVPILLSFLDPPVDSPCFRSVCAVLESVADKTIFRAYTSDIDKLYTTGTAHLLFKSCHVHTKCYLELLLSDLQSVRQNTDTTVYLECVRILADKVDINQSIILLYRLVDVYMWTGDVEVLRAARVLVLKAPCKHPGLALVATLLLDRDEDLSDLDLIVFPRRQPTFIHRDITLSCESVHAEPVEPVVPVQVHVPEQVESRPITAPTMAPGFQPAVTREKRKFDDLPDFVMDGPDS